MHKNVLNSGLRYEGNKFVSPFKRKEKNQQSIKRFFSEVKYNEPLMYNLGCTLEEYKPILPTRQILYLHFSLSTFFCGGRAVFDFIFLFWGLSFYLFFHIFSFSDQTIFILINLSLYFSNYRFIYFLINLSLSIYLSLYKFLSFLINLSLSLSLYLSLSLSLSCNISISFSVGKAQHESFLNWSKVIRSFTIKIKIQQGTAVILLWYYSIWCF